MTAEQWHLDGCGSAVVDGQTVPACHLSEETAHDPRVTLTEVLAAHDDPEGWYYDDSDDLRYQCNCGEMSPALTRATEAIEPRHCAQASDWHRAHVAEVIETTVIAARLAPIRAIAEQWDTGCAREVLAALDAPQDDAWDEPARHCHCGRAIPCRQHPPQDAPRGPVGDEQGAEVAGGRSEDERPGEADADGCGTCRGLVWCPICEDEREAQHWTNEKATE